MNLLQIRQRRERISVTERNEDDTVVSQGTERAKEGRLLSTTGTGSRDEHASVLARELAGSPELTSGVPEGLYPTQQRERNEARGGKEDGEGEKRR